MECKEVANSQEWSPFSLSFSLSCFCSSFSEGLLQSTQANSSNPRKKKKKQYKKRLNTKKELNILLQPAIERSHPAFFRMLTVLTLAYIRLEAPKQLAPLHSLLQCRSFTASACACAWRASVTKHKRPYSRS